MEMNMYVKTARAAVWVDVPEGQAAPAAAHAGTTGNNPLLHTANRIAWAHTPLHTPHGRCVALRQVGSHLMVALAAAPAVVWRPARQVLGAHELAAWLRRGF